MEEKQQIEKGISKVKETNAQLIGIGDEKRFSRKTVIVDIENKWFHFYGKTYKSCFQKAVKKIKKKEK